MRYVVYVKRETLDDELLIRTAHGVKPTARAEVLWPIVRKALWELESAIAPTDFDISNINITFRMAMADATAVLWLPPLVKEIEKDAPHIDVRMVPLTTRDPRPMLLRGDIDMAIGIFPGVSAQLASMADSALRHERLYSSRYVCVMRKGHPLANQELTLDAYCAANHLLMSFSGRAHGQGDQVLAQMGRKRRILLTVNQFFTAGRVVANSDLITVLPRHLIASTGMTGTLIAKELPFELPNVHVDMLWHERDARNPAHKWMRELLIRITANAADRDRPRE